MSNQASLKYPKKRILQDRSTVLRDEVKFRPPRNLWISKRRTLESYWSTSKQNMKGTKITFYSVSPDICYFLFVMKYLTEVLIASTSTSKIHPLQSLINAPPVTGIHKGSVAPHTEVPLF